MHLSVGRWLGTYFLGHKTLENGGYYSVRGRKETIGRNPIGEEWAY